MATEWLRYDVTTRSYSAEDIGDVNGTVPKVDFCNGIKAVNTGDTTVIVNDEILYPGTVGTLLGDVMSDGGNKGELYVGKIRVVFKLPLGANPVVQISQKYYIPEANDKPRFV